MRLVEVRFEALGSDCHLLGVSLAPGRLAWATAWVADRHDRFSRFEAYSELCRINATAGRLASVSDELVGLMRDAPHSYLVCGCRVLVGTLATMIATGC